MDSKFTSCVSAWAITVKNTHTLNLTWLPFSRRPTSREHNTQTRLLFLSSWRIDLHTQTWPRYHEDIPAYEKWSSTPSLLEVLKDRQTRPNVLPPRIRKTLRNSVALFKSLVCGKVSKCYYSALKSQLGWLNLPHLTIIPPPVTVKNRVVKFQEMSMTTE